MNDETHATPSDNIPPTGSMSEASEAIGSQIGPYKLLQEIGEGGMGAVYMAQQVKPIKRRVALKIIKAGMDTKQIVARFEAERQALAMMDHANIAQVLDVGTTERGRPYFVMELIKGLPITQYCDDKNMTVKERLHLFMSVCDAVQHAHQKGIIHRDLKPSNILVAEYDGKPIPKIIDFGLVKALHQQLTDKTMFTQLGQVVGTLEYMSPEQAKLNQLDVDTRSDIYSLGALLYELLSGEMPFDRKRLRTAAFDEMLRIIREEEPPRPSARLNSSQSLPAIATNRNVEAKELHTLVCGDLDSIVMKALAKERNRRYESAWNLAEDVQNFLEHRPVSARPPSISYRTRKFLTRNRAAVLRSVLLGGLLAVSAIAILKWNDAKREEWFHETLNNAETLLESRKTVAAFELLEKARELHPEDPRVRGLFSQSAMLLSVESDPPAASMFAKPFGSDDWSQIGETPLLGAPLPRVVHHWRIQKPGFVTTEGCVGPNDTNIRRILDEEKNIPAGMVRVSSADPAIGNFFLDKFEVSNADYQRFVDGGGYQNLDFWKYTIVVDAKEIPLDEYVSQLTDSTGAIGPRDWVDGHFPEGQGKLPVRGISWYEAAAYAAHVGKVLPSTSHWSFASGKELSADLVEQSNMRGLYIAEGGKFPSVGPFGTYDMAGNVSEWCFNEAQNGKRFVRGGCWSDPDYLFTSKQNFPADRRDDAIGFRCAKYVTEPAAELLDTEFSDTEPYHKSAEMISDAAFEIVRSAFDYDPCPLNAKVRLLRETNTWIEQLVEVDAAYGPARVPAHLFTPKPRPARQQLLIVFPGGDSHKSREFEYSKYKSQLVEPLLASGRAVMWPIYDGMYQRGDGIRYQDTNSKQTQEFIRQVQDLRRCIDYLQEDESFQGADLGYFGTSYGGRMGSICLAVEDRLAFGVLLVGGLRRKQPTLHMDTWQFAPRVRVPVLMINGKEDSIFPYEESQVPLFEAIGGEPKNKLHKTFEGGHSVAPNIVCREVTSWLDEHFGPIRR